MTPLPIARQRALGAHRERYGCVKRFAAAAPGRVNLLGEHTDYNGGDVLPIAINLECCAVISHHDAGTRAEVHVVDLCDTAVFKADDLDVYRADQRTHAAPGESWRAYVAGVLALMEWRGPGLHITIAGDVPRGSGLSSSAAFEVALATALGQALGQPSDPIVRARLCQRVEHEFAGVPCGLMDQAVSCVAIPGHALHLRCREPVSFRHVPLPPAAEVLVVDTLVPRTLASTAYAARVAGCRAAAGLLGVRHLADASPIPFGESLIDRAHVSGEDLAPLVRHVTTEQARVNAAAAAMEAGDVARLGALLNESHASLRDEYRVSCRELDCVVDTSVRSGLAWGAKMTGAGFGGCAVVLAHAGAAHRLAEHITSSFQRRFGRSCSPLAVQAGGGAACFDVD